jgi:hypothetical protein
MSRLDEMAKQAPVTSKADLAGSKLWNEPPIASAEIELPGERSAISKIGIGELYVFIFKVFAAAALVLLPFVVIYLMVASK